MGLFYSRKWITNVLTLVPEVWKKKFKIKSIFIILIMQKIKTIQVYIVLLMTMKFKDYLSKLNFWYNT